MDMITLPAEIDPQALVTAASQELSFKQSILARSGVSGGFRALIATDKPTPAAARSAQQSRALTKLTPAAKPAPKAPPKLPSQIDMHWNPITFSGFETHGHATLTLFATGEYSFHGSFIDPSAWDYDDSLAWGVLSSKGKLFTFGHSGSMHGWFDRWIEGGSDVDSWTKTGTNLAIKAAWPELCAGYHWQAQAAINWDIAGLETLVVDLIKAVETIVEVIAVIV